MNCLIIEVLYCHSWSSSEFDASKVGESNFFALLEKNIQTGLSKIYAQTRWMFP
jgi:hypothetical protein